MTHQMSHGRRHQISELLLRKTEPQNSRRPTKYCKILPNELKRYLKPFLNLQFEQKLVRHSSTLANTRVNKLAAQNSQLEFYLPINEKLSFHVFIGFL